MASSFVFKQLETLGEMVKMQELERHVWDMECTPTLLTYTTTGNGGVSLGAFDGEKIVGFSYGFPGYKNGQVYLCSHMLGIHKDYRHQGLGSKLKWKQRELALKNGYGLITWTYDPLETANATLNLKKLRAIGARYYENHYGDLSDGLNDGLPTDRFLVEWWIGSKYPLQPPSWITGLGKESGPLIFHCRISSCGWPAPEQSFSLNLDDENLVVLMPVPIKFQELKRAEPSIGLEWRMLTRASIARLLGNGFVAVDLIKDGDLGYYVFVNRNRLNSYLTGAES